MYTNQEIQEVTEVKTTLVSYKLYKIVLRLAIAAIVLWFLMHIIGDHPRRSARASIHTEIASHPIFKYFKSNPFVKRNFDTMIDVAIWLSIFLMITIPILGIYLLSIYNRGFIKIGVDRLNANGAIYRWEELKSLKFIINSPKMYGERSAREGFQNWIQFESKGKVLRYEFYIKTTVMEDHTMKVIDSIKNRFADTKVEVVECKKPWYLRILEELGIDPQ